MGAYFFSFHLAFWKSLKMDFWQKSSYIILVIFQMIVFFQKPFLCSHTYICLNEKLHLDVFCEITWVEFLISNWNGTKLICNIWLSTSSSLVIAWIIFEVYLHFAIYRYDYNFFIYIIFNHLISISKWDIFLQSYFLGFEAPHSKYYLQKIFSILAW